MAPVNMCRTAAMATLLLTLAACGQAPDPDNPETISAADSVLDRDSVLGLFSNYDDPNVTLEVNRYIWSATLEVLSFLPVEAADPFSGVIVFGYGTPPGGRTAYRATVHVKDPALDARSLNLALTTRSGPAAPDTVRAVENAILTRARQLRVAENKL